MTTESIMIAFFGSLGTIFTGLIVWGIKALVGATIKNTQELAVLNSKLTTLVDKTDSIGKIKEDLNHLHAWRKQQENKT